MKCKDFKRKISEYADLEMVSSEKQYFISHAKECPACDKAYKDALRIKNIVSSIAKQSVSAGFSQRVMQKINMAKIENSFAYKFVHMAKLSLFAAAALLIVVLAADYSIPSTERFDTSDGVSIVAGYVTNNNTFINNGISNDSVLEELFGD